MPLAARLGGNWAAAPVVRRWWRFSAYVVKRFQGDGGLQIASSLTYTSLLSLVPLLAVSLVILSGFGAFDEMRGQVQETLLDFVLPDTADQVNGYILKFMENAQKLTAPGVIALGVTAIMMLSTIEGTFNRIWRANAKRPWPIRILAFWAVLTLGPILLGVSISVSSVFQDYSNELQVGWLVRESRFALPFFLQLAAFSALYLAIPAVPVRIGHALVGGLVAAVLFQVLKVGFAAFVASADNYRTVYGALAAIPIFLLWLYSFWTLLLIGAHIAAALPERRLLGDSGLIDQATAESRLRAAMLVLRRLWQAAGARETLRLENLDPEPSPWVLNQLEKAGLIARLDDESLIAGCDFNRAPIGVLWRALDLATPRLDDSDVPAVLTTIMEAERDFMTRPLADLLEKPAEPGTDRA